MTSQDDSPFWIGDTDAYASGVGRLVAMLRYARVTTQHAVHGLTTEQLDYLHDAESNSIGMLLAHMAAVEVAYQIDTFENRDFSADELKEWGPALDLGEPARIAIRGQPLEHYLQTLATRREVTLQHLATVPAEWLDTATIWNGYPANNYFKWFHVMEDEVNHRGQIRWLRRRLPL